MTKNQIRVSGGAAAACFVAITQLITRDCITISQQIAAACFAITMPVFIVVFAVPGVENVASRSPRYWWWLDQIAGNAGIVFLVGVGALFWSLSWWISAIFMVGSLIAGVLAIKCPRPPEA